MMKEKEKNETMFLVKDPPMYTKRSRQSKLINNHLKTKSVGEKKEKPSQVDVAILFQL